MRKTILILAALSVIFLMNSCFSGRTTLSHTQKYADGELRSLYVYIEDFGKYRNYAAKFEKELQEQLAAEGIPTKFFIQKELDLTDPKDIGRDIVHFGATHVMRISSPSGVVLDGGQRTILTFGVHVENAQSNDNLWDTVLQMKTGLIKTKNEAGDAVKIMIKKMKEDGIIKS